MAGGVVGAVGIDVGCVGKDDTVLVGVLVAPVGEEFGHVGDVGVAAFEGVGAAGVVYADQEGFLAAVGHFGDLVWMV